MIFILGVLFGFSITILLLIGQAILHKKGISIDTPIHKIAKRDVFLINPKKEAKIKKIHENV